MNNISLPEAFLRQMRELLGREAEDLFVALDQPSPTSIRLSRHKPVPTSFSLPLGQEVPWCQRGYYLPDRPLFTGDPLLHSGYYYVQEASSMILDLCAPLLRDVSTALDLCAAPGGKSTLLSDILPEDAVLVSNEVVPLRAHILSENLLKWGNPKQIVTSASPAKLGKLRGIFDFILVDAPCSGEGMFRKDPQARKQWQASSPALCAERQREILSDIWEALAPGGLMVYSTCTLNREENEDVLRFITDCLGAEPIQLPEEKALGLRSQLTDQPCYRLMPHRTRGEGLFFALVRKLGEPAQSSRSRKREGRFKSISLPTETLGWLKDTYNWCGYEASEGTLYALPEVVLPLIGKLLPAEIRVLHAGIPLVERKGKSLSPHPALVYSTALDTEAWECVEISREEVVHYLGRLPLDLPKELSAGYKLLVHKGISIGIVKHLGNRTNSLYPQEWRIRHPERILSALREEQTDHHILPEEWELLY